MPFWTGFACVCLAAGTVVLTGPVSSPTVEYVLSAEVAADSVVEEGFLIMMNNPKRPAQQALLPVPISVKAAWQPMEEMNPNPFGDANDTVTADAKDPTLPIDTLRRIKWAPSRGVDSAIKHFSPDGEPPF